MENELELTESQLRRFEKLWFIFGNYGKKSTHLNHKLVQGFFQYRENRIEAYRDGNKNIAEKYGKEEAEKYMVTEECIVACEEVLNNP